MLNNKKKYWQEIFDRSEVKLYSCRSNFAHHIKANIIKFSKFSKLTNKYNSSDIKNKNKNKNIKNKKKAVICISSTCLERDSDLSLVINWLESLLFYLKINISACELAIVGNAPLGISSKFEEHNNADLMSFINKAKMPIIINLSKNIEFIGEKFNYRDYDYIKSTDISHVLLNNLLNKKVLLDVLLVSD